MHRIGVFGASFNPPTRGHQDVIEQALPYFDEIWLVPSAYHAFQKPLIPLAQRLAMLKLFLQNWQTEKIKIINIEEILFSIQPQKAVFTFDVLSALQALCQIHYTSFQLTFILGPDNKDPAIWQKFYRFADIEKKWPLFIAQERLPIRSTLIRELVKQNSTINLTKADLTEFLDEKIAHYILTHNLYQTLNPKPLELSISLAVFSFFNHELYVLLRKDLHQPTPYSLLTTSIQEDDASLEATAHRSLKEGMNLTMPYLEQVGTIGNNQRDPQAWATTVIYYGLIRAQTDLKTKDPSLFAWVTVKDALNFNLINDHRQILQDCLQRFQNKSLYTSLPIFLLTDEFSLSDIQHVYEAVLGFKMEKKSFRRRLLDANFLIPTGMRRAKHRPAQLYHLSSSEPYYFSRIIEGVRGTKLVSASGVHGLMGNV